ncbi:MAG: hypothetical protein JWO57_3269 [Pseudonocardiales bacterium]|nr:hypothetical protein [Pseudonocardiales bacterium]
MFVAVTQDGIEVGEPDDCRSLDVRAAAGDMAAVDAALRAGGLGRWDGGAEADLDLADLRRRAQTGAISDSWPARWDAMVGYARGKGWLSADGTTVRAHVVAL